MDDLVAPQQHLTIEEYLELEKEAPVRHEHVGGQLRAMTGATRRHNLISLDIVSALRQAARGPTCRVHMSEVKVQTPARVIYYPDIMVTCNPESGDPYVITDPCLLVEVSSHTTGARDRWEKLAAYRTIPTLKAYLIVDQDRRRVDRAFRLSDGKWIFTVEVDTGDGAGEVRLPCPFGAYLYLRQIYAGL